MSPLSLSLSLSQDARANIFNKDAFSGLLCGNWRFKKIHVLSSITKHKNQQAHLIPSVTPPLKRASFHFLSENQD